MTLSIDRRATLALLTAGLGAACAPKAGPGEETASAAASSLFLHGVASGDPASDSVVLWTRISPADPAASLPVSWELARDAAFAQIVASGEIEAGPGNDHTVKVIPEGLEPGTRYHYRFTAAGNVSPTGRTRTLPVGRVETLGIALASCSNYAFGHFNAYQAIADDPRVDIVLHTGDYIYEYGAGEWGDETATALGRRHQPPREIVSLADYRERFAQYRSDAGAQAMHGAHPFIACWDDHESTNNPWTGGAQNHQPATEGDWLARRAAALQAYYEWMPVREPGPGRTREQFWRTYVFGDLATLVTLETRHTGRSEQVSYADWFARIATRADRDAFMADVIGNPSRTMLSPEMEADLSAALAASKADGQPWRLIGNASPIARMLVPDLAALGIDPARNRDPASFGQGPDLLWTGRWNLPFYTDTWDGYPAARERLYALAQAAGVNDLIFLTGDSHSFWMNTLADASGQPMGLELGTAGITSPGDFVETGWDAETSARLDRLFAQELEEVVWTDNLHQGYVRVDLTPTGARADFVAVDTVLLPQFRAFSLRATGIAREGDRLVYTDPA